MESKVIRRKRRRDLLTSCAERATNARVINVSASLAFQSRTINFACLAARLSSDVFVVDQRQVNINNTTGKTELSTSSHVIRLL